MSRQKPRVRPSEILVELAFLAGGQRVPPIVRDILRGGNGLGNRQRILPQGSKRGSRSTMKHCSTCGVPSKGFDQCVKCRVKTARDEGYTLGYQTGFLKGQADSPLQLTQERWRQLNQLCHPDKHGDSRTATDVFQWLQSVKPC